MITDPTPPTLSARVLGPGTRKWRATLLALRRILRPELHTPATTNGRGFAYNKLAELGCVRSLRESLSNRVFVRSVCPLAAEMPSTCVFVYSGS